MSKNNIKYMKCVGVFVFLALVLMPFVLGEPDKSCLDSGNLLVQANITIDDGKGQPDFFFITSTERCEYGCVNLTGTTTSGGQVAGECAPHPVMGNIIVGIIFLSLLVVAFFMDRNGGDVS